MESTIVVDGGQVFTRGQILTFEYQGINFLLKVSGLLVVTGSTEDPHALRGMLVPSTSFVFETQAGARALYLSFFVSPPLPPPPPFRLPCPSSLFRGQRRGGDVEGRNGKKGFGERMEKASCLYPSLFPSSHRRFLSSFMAFISAPSWVWPPTLCTAHTVYLEL